MRRSRRLPLDELAPYLLDVPDVPTPLAWAEVFGNARPVELEVGFGKGLFLLRTAAARPDVNFVGVEILRKYQLYSATRLAKRGLRNVRLARADAREFLRDHVAEASLQAVHVYFPDPWWKRRHVKRRVFTAEFAVECQRVLAPGGALHLATDVADYFEYITKLVAEHTALRRSGAPEPGAPADDLDYLSNFERRFRKEGREVYRALFLRPGG